MNKIINYFALVLLLTGVGLDAAAQSAIYACGHIRRHREVAIDNLRNSGYTTAIIFNVSVEQDGSLTTDFSWSSQTAAEAGGIICKDGEYVFETYQPHYIDDINSLLAQPTSINRLEFCIGGWTNGSYGNIKSLVEREGTGPESMLYRNFKALKEVLPAVVAINNDQEQDYDLNSAVAFHKMLYQIGYKTTIAPYTRQNYWQQLVEELNSEEQICDLVYLQTYGGGSNNNPQNWKVFGDIPMYVGFDSEANSDINTMINSFTNWSQIEGVTGGFIWNYNNEDRNQNLWAAAINKIFNKTDTGKDVATFYKRTNFRGTETSLPAGEYDQATLSLHGLAAKYFCSFKLEEGYKLTAYLTPDLSGESKEWTASASTMDQGWNNAVCSLKIEAIDNSTPAMGADNGVKLTKNGRTVIISGLNGSENIRITDINGITIRDISEIGDASLTVSTSEFPSGFYFVTINSRTFKLLL